MKALVIALGVLVVVALVVLATWMVGAKRAAEAIIGKPTPEEARVKVDDAKVGATKAAEEKAEEVLHASPEDNLRRAREFTKRGLRPRDE